MWGLRKTFEGQERGGVHCFSRAVLTLALAFHTSLQKHFLGRFTYLAAQSDQVVAISAMKFWALSRPRALSPTYYLCAFGKTAAGTTNLLCLSSSDGADGGVPLLWLGNYWLFEKAGWEKWVGGSVYMPANSLGIGYTRVLEDACIFCNVLIVYLFEAIWYGRSI